MYPETRKCPLTGCEGLPCARLEDDDESRWSLDMAQWERERIQQEVLARSPLADGWPWGYLRSVEVAYDGQIVHRWQQGPCPVCSGHTHELAELVEYMRRDRVTIQGWPRNIADRPERITYYPHRGGWHRGSH